VKGHQNDLPTKNSISSYISCLKAVMDGGTNYVRSTAADLISELNRKWSGNAEFDELYREFLVEKTRWPFTREEVKLKIQSEINKRKEGVKIQIPE
jgi:hypothetical protein